MNSPHRSGNIVDQNTNIAASTMMNFSSPTFFSAVHLLSLTMQDYYTCGWDEEAPVEFLKQRSLF